MVSNGYHDSQQQLTSASGELTGCLGLSLRSRVIVWRCGKVWLLLADGCCVALRQSLVIDPMSNN